MAALILDGDQSQPPVKKSALRLVINRIIPQRYRRAVLRACPILNRFSPRIVFEERPYDIAAWDFFYKNTADPWHLSSRPAEAEKYAYTLELCGKGPFKRALEIGCCTGLFTAILAPSCESLLAVDISEEAVARTRARTGIFPQVSCQRLSLPKEMPSGSFELIVCSDVLYYWPESDLRRALPRFVDLLTPGGHLVAVHWLGLPGAINTGRRVHQVLREELQLTHVEGSDRSFTLVPEPWRFDVFAREKQKGDECPADPR